MSEELNPVEQAVETTPQEAQPVSESIDYSTKSLKEIVEALQELLETGDMQQLHKNAEVIKACFYKKLRSEKIAAGLQEESGDNPFSEIENAFKELFSKYRTMRAQFNSEMEKDREANFEARQSIIEELKSLLEKQDGLKDSFPAFRELQAKWREIGPVAQAKVKDVYDTYQHYVEMFYDYVKINKEFRDLDFKKNLELKEELCKRVEALADEEDVVEAFRTLQKCHEEWKEIGPVGKEYREEIWDRFREATSVINKKHQAYFEAMKGTQEENLKLKEALCDKVEAMLKEEIADSNKWNALTKEIENIQKEWRSIGFATKKDNQKIYDRFRKACDDFFTRKREFYGEYKDKMQENMNLKIALCEAAEALKESTAWKETSDKLIELQKQWKEIGPVSRKKSEQIWKRFRGACDAFFENRDKNGGKSGVGANLEAKKSLIDEVKSFIPGESREEAVSALKAFQARFKEIGFVPFKEKDTINSAFKDAIEEQFAKLRGESRRPDKGSRRGSSKVFSEYDKMVQAFRKKEQEITTLENNIGFFAKSKNADAFINDIRKQIADAQAELAALEDKIKEYEKGENNEQ